MVARLDENRFQKLLSMMEENYPQLYDSWYAWVVKYGARYRIKGRGGVVSVLHGISEVLEKFLFVPARSPPLFEQEKRDVKCFSLPVLERDDVTLFKGVRNPIKIVPNAVICSSSDPPGKRALFYLVSGLFCFLLLCFVLSYSFLMLLLLIVYCDLIF